MTNTSPAVPTYDVTPAERLDFTIDWRPLLDGLGDGTASVMWIVPAGVTKASEAHAAGVSTVWIDEPALGRVFTLRCRLVTTGGREFERAMLVRVVDRR